MPFKLVTFFFFGVLIFIENLSSESNILIRYNFKWLITIIDSVDVFVFSIYLSLQLAMMAPALYAAHILHNLEFHMEEI